MSLDEATPLPAPPVTARLGDRGGFSALRWPVYANHAAISPPSDAVRAAMAQAAQAYATEGVGAFPACHAQRLRLKGRLAHVFGGAPADYALVLNTSAGLMAVAQCVAWRPGDRVVVFQGEFPTNVTPWQVAARTFGLEVVTLPLAPLAAPGGADLAALEAALKAGVRLVALSAVQFQTGLRAPVAAISALCRAHGALLSVDGIQAAGVAPLHAPDCDFLAIGGHKWLMGPEGAGVLYIHPDQVGRLVPRVAGWLSHEEAVDFLFEPHKLRYDKPIKRRADFLEGGAPNSVGYAGLEVALMAIEHLGVPAIFAHVNAWLDALAPTVEALGFTTHRLPDADRRSGILAALPPEGLSAGALAAGLAERGIAVTTPDGRLRFSPHWPNALAEVSTVAAALEETVKALRG
ncbi:MAG: aminotransferase class V-fold PLP-dependent enzyme [Myxococcales bacterium]|nr:aminotransferase class V-fold PLP-dependent enzyme [Myxococcales bacterium]